MKWDSEKRDVVPAPVELQVAGIPVRVDPKCPPDQVVMVRGETIVGRITGLRPGDVHSIPDATGTP